jgi:hypothetical protein
MHKVGNTTSTELSGIVAVSLSKCNLLGSCNSR